MDQHGYLKLTDFGLAKQATLSNTFCGTPEYVSPEMLTGSGHNKTVDWWALGILIYEMLAGIPPFYDKDVNQMFQNIQKANIIFPNKKDNGFEFSKNVKDLIMQLLQRDKNTRLGAKNGADDILAHKFFRDINMTKILNRVFKAPYIPQNEPCQKTTETKENQPFQEDFLTPAISETTKLIVDQNQDKFKSFGKNMDAVDKKSKKKKCEK